MATVVVMPKLGLTMTEGLVGCWLVREGDLVRKGQPLVEVVTEKITNEVEAPEDGVLLKILVPEGDTVPVATPIGYVGARDEVLLDGIDQVQVASAPRGSRHEGEDNAAARIADRDELVPLSPLRRVIGQRLTQSFRDVPHFSLTREIDMSASITFRQQFNERLSGKQIRVSFNDLLVKATALALRQHPAVNASFEDPHLRYHTCVNVGVAVAIPDGLIVPVVKDADRRPLADIAMETKRLVEAAQTGRLTENDVAGGTFTVSNMGMYGVDLFTAIINPPQSAILAAGRIAERSFVVSGHLEVRPTCFLSLSSDHRVLDGAVAAAFLTTLRSILEEQADRLEG